MVVFAAQRGRARPAVRVVETPDGSVEIRRSTRRTRTVSASRREGRIVLQVPATLSLSEEEDWARSSAERIVAKEQRRRPNDAELAARARRLQRQFFPGQEPPAGITWVTNMTGRWGSCSGDSRTIRLSHRLQGMPAWVQDSVLVHELAHLDHPDHSPAFWAAANRFPQMERARGFLAGVDHAEHRETETDL